MSQRYANASMIVIALSLAGCASTSQGPAVSIEPGATGEIKETVIDVEGEFEAAVQLMKIEDWHAASEKLAAITSAQPRLSGAWMNLGIAHSNIGNGAAAETAFKRAIDTNTRQVAAYNELGIIYRRSDRLEDAASIYNEGLKIDPDNPDLHWNLGILYDRYLPNPAQALIHYEYYRQLTQSEDRQLLAWISELREQAGQVNVATGEKR